MHFVSCLRNEPNIHGLVAVHRPTTANYPH